MLGACASIATAGSFCLFCGNVVVGLPQVTSASPPDGVEHAPLVAAVADGASTSNDRANASPQTRQGNLIGSLPRRAHLTTGPSTQMSAVQTGLPARPD